MNTQALYDFIFQCRPPGKLLNPAYQSEVKRRLQQVIAVSYFSRKQLLLSSGQVAGHLYFVNKGLVRAFYYDKEHEKEITSILWNAHSIVAEPESFFKQLPSKYSIEVMADTELLSVTYEQLIHCTEAFPEIETLSRNIALQYSALHAKRNLELTMLSAWQRYLNLLKTHSDIEQQVSKEIIASYLNITPQSLSRLLKEKGHP